MATFIDFAGIANSRYPEYLQSSAEWLEWRYCYEGGRLFRDRYLQQYSDKETIQEFERRRSLTPIPTYAKREVNRVRNSLFQRFGDIIRRGGTEATQMAIAGEERGVDNNGSSMNVFLGKSLLADLLVMGRVGVLTDAPRVAGTTMADVPQGFRPYFSIYSVENIPMAIKSAAGRPSDYQSVLLLDNVRTADPQTGKYTDDVSYRYYWVDEMTGRVKVQILDTTGQEKGEVIDTGLTEIPFVMFDIGTSLMQDVCQHQVALLNLISSDTSYAIESNYPFLTRQRGNANNSPHLQGSDKSAEVGVKKGLFYDKALERPQFISPPTDPMNASLALRRELKEEVRELVSGVVMDLGEDGTIDSGLAFIGLILEDGEERCWDHYTAFETANPSRRRVPTVKYPDRWCLKTDKERIEDASAFLDLMYKIPGRVVKKEIAKLATDILLRGKVSTETLDSLQQEIDEVPYCTSDPKIIIEGKKQGLISDETGALALGGTEEEAEKAAKDQARRAAAIVAAQSDSAGARGNPDGSVDPSGSASLEKEGSADTQTKLGAEGDEGVRGESDDLEDESEIEEE